MVSYVYNYIQCLRVKHWIKNLFLFAAPFFGGTLFTGKTFGLMIPAFISFSLGASAVYVFNDIQDIESDKLHPEKKKRPIASGLIGKRSAVTFSVLLFALSLLLAYSVKVSFLLLVMTYFVIQIAYSSYFKHVAIMDIFSIASGFVLRVLAGGAAFNVRVSDWLLLTMFMISLVLATGKRLSEARLLHDDVGMHRKSLNAYSISTLNEILVISSAAALIAYALYTVEQFQRLVYTVPVVTFGLFRYLLLSKQGLGEPVKVLTEDKWLLMSVILWLGAVGFIRYFGL